MEENMKDPIDCLFDEENNDPIVLLNEKGEEQAFEQIAVIPQSKRLMPYYNLSVIWTE